MPGGSAGQRSVTGMLRWSMAALAALALHVGLVWLAMNLRTNHAEAAAGAPESAIMVDLAAMEVAPEVPAPPAAEPPAEPPRDEAEAEAEPQPQPQQAVTIDVPLPILPPLPEADAMLPAPAPVTPPRLRRADPPAAVAKPRPVRRKPAEKPRRMREASAPPPPAQPSRAPMQDARGSSAQLSELMASWRGSVRVHINRYKYFPESARPGQVRVSIAIDGQGRVLSARLVTSSGDATLDAEAVAMIRRASPVPAPPSGPISVTLPINYAR